jgi:hypothetical protein
MFVSSEPGIIRLRGLPGGDQKPTTEGTGFWFSQAIATGLLRWMCADHHPETETAKEKNKQVPA